MHFLLVKTHRTTRLKYLCKHSGTKESCNTYLGSGKYWKRHLKKHGSDISTEVLLETNNLEELKQQGVFYSNFWDIVKSKNWANLIPETGFPLSGKLHPAYGNPAWNKNKKYTEEHRKKLSLAHKGKKCSEEHKRRISLALKGRQFSEETRKKLSLALIGKNVGKKHSKEAKRKISLARIGKKHTDETKRKIGLTERQTKANLIIRRLSYA